MGAPRGNKNAAGKHNSASPKKRAKKSRKKYTKNVSGLKRKLHDDYVNKMFR